MIVNLWNIHLALAERAGSRWPGILFNSIYSCIVLQITLLHSHTKAPSASLLSSESQLTKIQPNTAFYWKFMEKKYHQKAKNNNPEKTEQRRK